MTSEPGTALATGWRFFSVLPLGSLTSTSCSAVLCTTIAPGSAGAAWTGEASRNAAVRVETTNVRMGFLLVDGGAEGDDVRRRGGGVAEVDADGVAGKLGVVAVGRV